jgi:hypothetical protein
LWRDEAWLMEILVPSIHLGPVQPRTTCQAKRQLPRGEFPSQLAQRGHSLIAEQKVVPGNAIDRAPRGYPLIRRVC